MKGKRKKNAFQSLFKQHRGGWGSLLAKSAGGEGAMYNNHSLKIRGNKEASKLVSFNSEFL